MSEDFIVSDDLVSDDDFVASEDFVSLGLADGVVVLPVAEPLVEPVADGDFVSLPVADGELPLLSGPVDPPVAAPDQPLGVPYPLGPGVDGGTGHVDRAGAAARGATPSDVVSARCLAAAPSRVAVRGGRDAPLPANGRSSRAPLHHDDGPWPKGVCRGASASCGSRMGGR